jgi:6-phosphogluconolactonase
VTAFDYDKAKGALKEVATVSTLPKDFSGTSHTAEVLVHPNGRFLYGSNRGHDSIAVFSLDGSGKPTPIEHVSTLGKTPRNFRIDPTGRWLFAANQSSGTVQLFRIDPTTGRLTASGQSFEVSSPVCVKFLPVR